MPSSYLRSTTYFSLGGLLLISAVLGGLWGPQNGLLHDAYKAESERLYQAFTAPLARALAHGDDLARVDELRRLQKLPTVVSANVDETAKPLKVENALVWGGKTLGTLDIRLRPTRWRMWRYRWWERALSVAIGFVLVAAVAGFFFHRTQVRHRLRVISMLRRQRARMTRVQHREKASAHAERRRWLGQAMEWTSKGLVLLDEGQRVVMANTAAMNQFGFGQQALGAHWLEYTASPEWAAALSRSVDQPGQRMGAPLSKEGQPVFLQSFAQPECKSVESTWITVG